MYQDSTIVFLNSLDTLIFPKIRINENTKLQNKHIRYGLGQLKSPEAKPDAKKMLTPAGQVDFGLGWHFLMQTSNVCIQCCTSFLPSLKAFLFEFSESSL